MSRDFNIYNEKQEEFYRLMQDLTDEQRFDILKQHPEAMNLTLATIMLSEEYAKDDSLDIDDWECSYDSLLFDGPIDI